MKLSTLCFVLSALTVLSASVAQAQPTKLSSQWTPLFNGENLDGFDTFLGMYEPDRLNDDPQKIVSVENGAIHIYKDTEQGSKVPFGYIVTQKEYSHYHLRFEYRWGEKKFAPRTNVVRDSGVIFHMVGPNKVWPRGVECQIQEKDTGDTFTVYGTQVTTTVNPNAKGSSPQFMEAKDGGVPLTQGGAGVTRIIKSTTQEKEGWNTVEIIVRGADEFVHIVNGVVNNRGSDIRELDSNGEDWIPLKKGKILFQVEGAEVLYRNIEIKDLADSK